MYVLIILFFHFFGFLIFVFKTGNYTFSCILIHACIHCAFIQISDRERMIETESVCERAVKFEQASERGDRERDRGQESKKRMNM